MTLPRTARRNAQRRAARQRRRERAARWAAMTPEERERRRMSEVRVHATLKAIYGRYLSAMYEQESAIFTRMRR